MRKRVVLILIGLLFLGLALFGYAEAVAAEPLTDTWTIYLPLISKAPAVCAPIDGVSYETLSVVNSHGEAPNNPATDPGFNLGLLGYNWVDAERSLVYYNGGEDPNAPTLYWLFGDHRTPAIPNVYQLHNSDGSVVTSYPVTMMGMTVTPAEIIYTPDSGYDIGDGYDAMVAYATQERITLIYNRNDDLHGYAIYIEGICTEPSLLALFQQQEADDSAPPTALPVVRGGQPLGRARGDEIRIVIRDQGTAMDPRACNSWWGHRCP